MISYSLTQREFGEVVGIAQSAVSDLIKRDVIDLSKGKDQAIRDYCAHIRKIAAGRGASDKTRAILNSEALPQSIQEWCSEVVIEFITSTTFTETYINTVADNVKRSKGQIVKDWLVTVTTLLIAWEQYSGRNDITFSMPNFMIRNNTDKGRNLSLTQAKQALYAPAEIAEKYWKGDDFKLPDSSPRSSKSSNLDFFVESTM